MSTAPRLALTFALLGLLPGCGPPDDTPPPDPDFGPPPGCDVTGCPAGEQCLPDGRCATEAEIRDGVRACTALSGCLGACPDPLCVDQCFAEAGDVGFRRYVDILDCVDRAGCFGADGTLDEGCMLDNCAAEYTACFGELPPEPEGTTRCGPFVQCLNDCPVQPPEDEQRCLDDCVRAASPEAFARYVAAVECVQILCPGGEPGCQQTMCAEALSACFDHGLGTGSLPCGDVLECAFACPDAECYDRCEVDASAEGLALWRAFVNCAAPAGCAGYDACLAACPAEARACESHM